MFRDTLRDGDLVFWIPYSLTNHATQPSHPEESDRTHRLWGKAETVSEKSLRYRRERITGGVQTGGDPKGISIGPTEKALAEKLTSIVRGSGGDALLTDLQGC